MITASRDMTAEEKKQKAKAKIKDLVENEIKEALMEILRKNIWERVYARRTPTYYQRTYQLLNAVDFEVKYTKDDRIVFGVFVNEEKLNYVHRASGLDAYALNNGVSLLGRGGASSIIQRVNDGRNPGFDGGDPPQFLERSREEILNSRIIEEAIANRLKQADWDIEVSF